MAATNRKRSRRKLTESELRTMVREIIAEVAPKQGVNLTSDTHLVEHLEYHSLALLELAFALEDEFDLSQIDEPTARKIQTVGDIENHVVGELRAQLVVPASAP